MSQLQLISVIENFDEPELREFLQNNGMSDCLNHFNLENINGRTFLNGMSDCLNHFNLENINGRTFLNLSNPEPTGWKNLVPISELMKVREFIQNLKENPQNYIIQSPPILTPQLPPKPTLPPPIAKRRMDI